MRCNTAYAYCTLRIAPYALADYHASRTANPPYESALLVAFCAGGLSHVITDSLTVQGVPLGWWSDRRFHLFGGRLHTGQMGEYWVAGAFVLACIGFNAATRNFGASEYTPFFWGLARLLSPRAD